MPKRRTRKHRRSDAATSNSAAPPEVADAHDLDEESVRLSLDKIYPSLRSADDDIDFYRLALGSNDSSCSHSDSALHVDHNSAVRFSAIYRNKASAEPCPAEYFRGCPADDSAESFRVAGAARAPLPEDDSSCMTSPPDQHIDRSDTWRDVFGGDADDDEVSTDVSTYTPYRTSGAVENPPQSVCSRAALTRNLTAPSGEALPESYVGVAQELCNLTADVADDAVRGTAGSDISVTHTFRSKSDCSIAAPRAYCAFINLSAVAMLVLVMLPADIVRAVMNSSAGRAALLLARALRVLLRPAEWLLALWLLPLRLTLCAVTSVAVMASMVLRPSAK